MGSLLASIAGSCPDLPVSNRKHNRSFPWTFRLCFLFAEGEEGEQGSKVAKVDGTGAGEEVDSITKASLPASRRACCICYS